MSDSQNGTAVCQICHEPKPREEVMPARTVRLREEGEALAAVHLPGPTTTATAPSPSPSVPGPQSSVLCYAIAQNRFPGVWQIGQLAGASS